MRYSIAAFVASMLITAMPGVADQKNPKVKNKEELAALQKVQAATDPTSQLAAIQYALENFSDTDYKPMLESMAMRASLQKGDMALVTTWTQRTLQDDPNNIEAHVILAEGTARHIRENDLDKAQTIATVQTNANQALALLKAANSPPVGVPEAQWPGLKQQLTGEAYEALGIVAEVDKKYPDAVADFKAGAAADPAGASIFKTRLAKAYVDNKQYDEAIATANEVLADAQAQPVVKQMAQQQKDAAMKMKGAK
jgi:tetratricopeptide (TPR) repeat protein